MNIETATFSPPLSEPASGALYHAIGSHSGEFDQTVKKVKYPGVCPGSWGWGVMIELGIDPYITLSACGSHVCAKEQEGHIHGISFLA